MIQDPAVVGSFGTHRHILFMMCGDLTTTKLHAPENTGAVYLSTLSTKSWRKGA